MSPAVQRFVLDPFLGFMAFLVAIVEATVLYLLLKRMGGSFARAVAPGEKIVSLEGLRGILAFSVVVHHGCCWYFFYQTGSWGTGRSIIFGRMASFGVIQFFFLSGYLFWGKLMRKGRLHFGRFYLSRFVRIGPVYYVCAGTAILIGLLVNGFRLQVPPAELLRSAMSWLLFCLGGVASVNGADTQRVIAGVTWTLSMEWGFYLLLPFLAWFSRRSRRLIWLALVSFTVWVLATHARDALAEMPHLRILAVQIGGVAKFMLVGFGGGILVAALNPTLQCINRLSSRQASFALSALYLAYLLVPGIEWAGLVLLLLAFALVVHGADLFGLITSRGVRLLGIISYDVYVVHGIIYYLASRLRGGIHPVPLWAYIPETLACMMIVIVVATALHLVIEGPTMQLSERIARGGELQPSQPELVTVAVAAE